MRSMAGPSVFSRFANALRYSGWESSCSRILEIGAHFGGSIFSMARGVECSNLVQSAEVVTVESDV